MNVRRWEDNRNESISVVIPTFFEGRMHMRVILFLNQIQAGYGGKERADTPLGLEKGGIGSYLMYKDYFLKENLQVLATVYCGPDYFAEHKEEVLHKIHNLILKTKAEVLFAGPCFNDESYTEMAANVASFIEHQTDCKTYVACSKENEEIIQQFKEHTTMIEMPKKGAVGLNDALKDIALIIAHDQQKSNRIYR